MKSKIILFLFLSALTTLSFTFASVHENKKVKVQHVSNKNSAEPIGGFISEGKL